MYLLKWLHLWAFGESILLVNNEGTQVFHSFKRFIYSFIHSFIHSFIFWEKRNEGEIPGEKHQYVVASCMPPTGDLAHNPGLCPECVPNWQSSVHWATPARAGFPYFCVYFRNQKKAIQHFARYLMILITDWGCCQYGKKSCWAKSQMSDFSKRCVKPII